MSKRYSPENSKHEEMLNVSIHSLNKNQKAEAVDLQYCLDLKEFRVSIYE